MSESTLTNLDGIPQYTSVDTHLYHTPITHTTNVDNDSMTIIVQNPFDDSSNIAKYHHDLSIDNQLSQHPVRFNQELLDNFGITIPITKQSSTTELIPLPSSLSNNFGLNIHSINNQPRLISYPTSTYNQQTISNGIYSRSLMQTRPINGNSPVILHYPTQQQYGHQMMKSRMISPNTYSQVIMPQQNSIYRANHLSPDNNILKSLLQINPEGPLKSSQMNVYQQSTSTISKPKTKRKRNDLNTSVDDNDIPLKSRKRKKKGAEETEKFVKYSLEKLRDLPMLTPIEPIIDIKNDLILNFSNIKSNYQGEFGDIFIENIHDYYRPYRRTLPIIVSNSLSERHYRLCSNFLDQPPSLPSPPLMINSSEKLIELTNNKIDIHDDDESIISTSTLADNDNNLINNIQIDNNYLLKTLSSSSSYDNDLRSLSPILISNENHLSTISTKDELEKNDRSIVDGTDKVSVTLTLTTEAANNVQSVIAAVADLLKIAYPSTFDVHQIQNNNNCTCSTISKDLLSLSSHTPISNLNRTTSIYKIGRETNISIQTLIDMQQKTCRHCSQNLITENFLKKRLNELPIHLRELISNSELFIYFCHEQCFNTYITNTSQLSNNIKNETIDMISTKNLSIKYQDKLTNNKRWKRWNSNLLLQINDQLSNANKINQLITDMKISIPSIVKQDKRICVFCNGIGDMANNGPGRLLNLDVGQWCHLNCALWSSEVYETRSGALMCVEQAYLRSINTICVICQKKGSSLSCFYQRCSNVYHFTCAIDNNCIFYKNKTIMCPIHASKTISNDEILNDKSVLRKVWINRDEIKQIQNYMHEEHEDKSYILRIGSLILHHIGQLLPHQLHSSTFNNRNFIYPVGYTVTRFYWSMFQPNRRCAYRCSIIDMDNKPMFRIRVEEEEFLELTAKDVWYKIVNKIDLLRQKHRLVKIFPKFITGEDLYGLTEPHIIRLIESLPGVEMLQNYAFKYGRLQLFDMPLTVNPTGCARSEPKLRTHFRRHAQTLTSSHSTRSALPRTVLGVENTQISYVKQFVLSKSTQYRKLKTEWRQNIYLAKSRIQGLGLFAARDLEKHTMVIEYIGEIIRNEVANKREKLYEQQNHGIYMFRLDDDYVVDATMSGCLARYINHSCEPNSIAEVVQIEKENKIIIITNRRIAKGEELMYDYKFDFEEDSKIPCLCGATNCRNWMN